MVKKSSVWLLTIVLVACTPPAQNLFETYNQRLINVLNTQSASQLMATEWPKRNSLVFSTTKVSIGFMDSLELQACDLLTLVNEHNSILGRVQSVSANFTYQVRFTQGLELCLEQGKVTDQNTRLWLSNIVRQKRQELPRYFWNMLATGEETYQFFKPGMTPLAMNDQDGFNQALETLSYLVQLKSNLAQQNPIPEVTLVQLEQKLSLLYNNSYLPRLLYSLELANQAFIQGNKSLIAGEEKIRCQPGYNRQTINTLVQVFSQLFAFDIQPYVALLVRRYQLLQPSLAVLFTLPDGVRVNTRQKLIADYYQSGKPFATFMSSMSRHVDLWQLIFSRCGIKPTQFSKF